MPHSGGGGHVGGSSHSSSSHSSAPRYDHSGKLHSHYYYKPGFYVHSRYVPYASKERKSISYFAESLFFFIISLGFIVGIIAVLASSGKYSESKLESFALSKYSEIYDETSSDYENKILITFVAYEDEQEYDFLSMIGDNVDILTDMTFGDKSTEFGSSLIKNIQLGDYYDNLYSHLASTMNEVNNVLATNPVYGGSKNSDEAYDINIINESGFGEISGKTELENECKEFYTLRGYNLSFLIANPKDAYIPDWGLVIGLSSFTALMIAIGIGMIAMKKKDIKEVEQEIKNGNAEKIFEGEDPFAEYYKNHPLD